MKKEDQNKKTQLPGNEDYDVNHPQHLTKPAFNSVTENRDSGNKPGTENLNHENDENKFTEGAKKDNSEDATPVNDERLHGNMDDRDLKKEQHDYDHDDDDLIRK
jgi:hypothetical protein